MSPEVPLIVLLIAIPTFFILRWILKRFIKNKKARNWTSIVATLIVAPILYFGLIIGIFSYLFYEPQYDFKKERWFADKNARFEMRDDLVNSRILIGKSKSEIIDLIGKSDSNDSTENWTYDLGMSGAGFGWQFNYLKLTFENDKVSDVKKQEIVD
jgi:preprotein translocase subunit YajC